MRVNLKIEHTVLFIYLFIGIEAPNFGGYEKSKIRHAILFFFAFGASRVPKQASMRAASNNSQ